MQQYEKVFIELLKAGLWGVAPEVPQGFDNWESVARLAKAQSVFAIVGQVMLTTPEISQNLPAPFRLKVKQLTLSHAHSHTLLNKSLVTVVEQMNQAGVDSILLKGQGLARNYPNPELRQCGDIDLYVGTDNALKSYEVMTRLAEKIDDRGLVEVGSHYEAVMPRGVRVEVHRYTDVHQVGRMSKIYNAASDKGVTENTVALDFAGTTVRTPSDDFNAFFVFNHLFRHFMTSGIGLRQFCDWMMFLHSRKGKLNLDYLRSLLDDMHLMKPWQAFGCLLVNELGLPADEFPFYNKVQEGKQEKIMRRVLDEGNFGKQRNLYKMRGSNYILNKGLSLASYLTRVFGLLFMFPRQSVQQVSSAVVNGLELVWADMKVKFK